MILKVPINAWIDNQWRNSESMVQINL